MAFKEWWNTLIVPKSLRMQEFFENAKPIAKKSYEAGRRAGLEEAAEVAETGYFDVAVDHKGTRGEAVEVTRSTIAAAIRERVK